MLLIRLRTSIHPKTNLASGQKLTQRVTDKKQKAKRH